MAKRSSASMTPESRENELINMAVNLAEKKLADGTASNQLIMHYLAMATSKAKLEKEKLLHETELLRAKTDSIKSEERNEQLYNKVVSMLKEYKGIDDEEQQDVYGIDDYTDI